MKSVPKPAYLDISFPTEAQLARRSPDDFYLSVSVRWRRAESFPPPLGMLDGMPRLPDGDEFEVLRRIDGSYTLIPKRWRDPGLRFGKGRPTLYELERAGKDMGWGKRLRSVSNLIEQYQPGFDYTASEKNAYYLLETLKHYTKVRKAAESLRNFLEYTKPGKHKPTP